MTKQLRHTRYDFAALTIMLSPNLVARLVKAVGIHLTVPEKEVSLEIRAFVLLET